MVGAAPLEAGDGGLYPAAEGWFVVNARHARWFHVEGSGYWCPFESREARFADLGVNLNLLGPGEGMSMYHAEDAQEDFLVLSGECLLIVEGQERRLKAWDFVHCPQMTEHVFVGAGDAPCLVLAVGARIEGRALVFPVDEASARHGTSVAKETSDPREAYGGFDEPRPTSAPELPSA